MRWIIGDIHGWADPLDRLIESVTSRDREAVFIFVGDYINRGPDSRGVVERLLRVPGARFCRGNHDNVWDLLLNRACYEVRADKMHAHHLFNSFLDAGLDRTMISYGVELAAVYALAVDWSLPRLHELLKCVPMSHRQFFRRLESIIEHEDIFIAHARWPINQPDGPGLLTELLAENRNLRQEVIWGRYSRVEIEQPKTWRRRGFFGHTPVSFYRGRKAGEVKPLVGENIILLDTAIALGIDGRLTAYCADNDRYVQVDRELNVAEFDAAEELSAV